MKKYLVWLLLFFSTSSALAIDTSGLKYSVATDLVGQLGAKHIDNAPSDRDRLLVREAEFSFYGPIDHIFEGTMSGAAHFENGVSQFELHEGFLQSSQLLPRTQMKLGLYALGVGRLNRVHRHEWPFIYAPKVHEEFFGEEAAFDTGLELSYLTPLPFYLNVTGGVGSGFTFGHAHSAGARPLTPTHYTRISSYQDLTDSTGMDIGLNYLGRMTADHIATKLYGLDFISKWTEGKTNRFLLQGEVWFSHVKNVGGSIDKKLGTYIFPQLGFSQFLAGVRFDTFSHMNKTNSLTRQRENNVHYTVVPTLTYLFSEFSKARLSYTNTVYRELSETRSADHSVAVQVSFILGAHPAHSF